MWLVAMLLPAAAGDLTWRWDQASPARYHAEALLSVPMSQVFVGSENVEARALQVGIAVDTTCRAELAGKVWRVACDLDKVAMEGVAQQGEQDKLDRIFAEYVDLLDDAVVEMEVRRDGHIRQLDVEGISKHTERRSVLVETNRQLMRRVFAPLCVQLPKDGKDDGKQWQHKGTPLAFEMISSTGTTGGMTYAYETKGMAGGTVLIQGIGRANVATHDQLEASGNVALNLVVAGQARFDPATGMLAYSEVSTTGVASATAMTVGPSKRYAYAGWMGRINADGSIEGLEAAVAAPPKAPEAPAAPEAPEEPAEPEVPAEPAEPDADG